MLSMSKLFWITKVPYACDRIANILEGKNYRPWQPEGY